MSDTLDRYTLALGVLAGEPDTHLILADLLEEDGERGLAQWARARKNQRGKRLDFVLALLPHKVNLRLGCDFYERVARRYRWPTLLEGLSWIRKWSLSLATSQDLANGCSILSCIGPAAYDPGETDRAAQYLQAAARCAETADRCEQQGELHSYRIYATETRNYVRRVAKASRNMCSKWSPETNELDWQINQVEQALYGLLEELEASDQPQRLEPADV